MTENRGIEPWDDAAMGQRLFEIAASVPRQRLLDAEAPRQAGAYLQWARLPDAPVLGLIATGELCWYAGVAADCHERLNRYRNALRDLDDLTRSIWIAFIPCSSYASALFAERKCIEHYAPLLNAGFSIGSKALGRRRVSQRATKFDALFPGRSGVPAASPLGRAQAHLEVAEYLARLRPDVPRWPPLPARPVSGSRLRLVRS